MTQTDRYEITPEEVKPLPYQIWPCQSIGKPGNYSVARPGDFPIFEDGAYHWSKEKAQEICDRRNAGPREVSAYFTGLTWAIPTR